MPADVAVSVVVLVGIVALSYVTRRLSTRALADTGVSEYAAEFVSTFQLCCCAHELKVLSEVGRIDPRLALTFTYLITVIHGFTFNGAIGNPTGVLECAYRSRLTRGRAFRRIACEFAAAAASRAAVPLIWGVGLSGIHVRHKLHDFQCISPVHAPLPQAAAVEFACAFAVQTVITYTRSIGGRSHVHAVAAIITTVVYAVPLQWKLLSGIQPGLLAGPHHGYDELRAAVR
ncbi:aquaporin-11 isoform X2 [Antennarius striatus]|uniref:aquaporin-11 isoform X2 n=1 Tax=Antennarius striatus TaxID=241820 RepID=UPI0035AEA164